MSSLDSHQFHTRRALDLVEDGTAVSQRVLARELGIALGLTNLLLRKMARKGWVRLVRIRPNRMRYLITPAGIAEKARMSQAYFAANVQFYRETRDRIRQGFDELSRTWPSDDAHGTDAPQKRVVFYGAGEVAEIASICLQNTDLTLVGVVDGSGPATFVNLPVQPLSALREKRISDVPFDKLVVMSFEVGDDVLTTLKAQGVPSDAVVWI